uniref:Uncharacterized protein n=1 Tax=Nothoprocta perdicaria TaxID=30464 RepID=A0A8C6Z2Y1_NOTPE
MKYILLQVAQTAMLRCIYSYWEFGLRRTSLFFMKPSFWLKRGKNYKELYEGSVNGSLSFSEMVEPVPSEFQGKEAIRYDSSHCPGSAEQITSIPGVSSVSRKLLLCF